MSTRLYAANIECRQCSVFFCEENESYRIQWTNDDAPLRTITEVTLSTEGFALTIEVLMQARVELSKE